jgi:hypothetical protein
MTLKTARHEGEACNRQKQPGILPLRHFACQPLPC